MTTRILMVLKPGEVSGRKPFAVSKKAVPIARVMASHGGAGPIAWVTAIRRERLEQPGFRPPQKGAGCDELRKCGIVFGHAHDVMGEKCMQNNQPEHEFIKNESLRHNPGIEMKVFFASRSV